MQRIMPVLQMPMDHDLRVQTNSCEDLTLTEKSLLYEKRSTISSLDKTSLRYHDSTLLNRTGSDFPCHMTLAGIRSFIYNRSLYLSERGCIQFFYFFFFKKNLFLRRFDMKVSQKSSSQAHVKPDTLSSRLVQYTLLKLRNQLHLITTQAKQHFSSCFTVSRTLRTHS